MLSRYIFNVFYIISIYIYFMNKFFSNISTFFVSLDKYLVKKFFFLQIYYLRSENIWLDGFLFDFLQKKTIDLWLRQYVILTGFLFSEKLVFDFVIRLYIDFFVNQLAYYNIFESVNVSAMLNITLFTLATCLLTLFTFNLLF